MNQLDSENLLSRYFRENNITMFLVSRQVNIQELGIMEIGYGSFFRISDKETAMAFRNMYDRQGNMVMSSYACGAFIDMKLGKAVAIPKELATSVPVEENLKEWNIFPEKYGFPKR